jgi:hypothetical protein
MIVVADTRPTTGVRGTQLPESEGGIGKGIRLSVVDAED